MNTKTQTHPFPPFFFTYLFMVVFTQRSSSGPCWPTPVQTAFVLILFSWECATKNCLVPKKSLLKHTLGLFCVCLHTGDPVNWFLFYLIWIRASTTFSDSLPTSSLSAQLSQLTRTEREATRRLYSRAWGCSRTVCRCKTGSGKAVRLLPTEQLQRREAGFRALHMVLYKNVMVPQIPHLSALGRFLLGAGNKRKQKAKQHRMTFRLHQVLFV